MVQLICAIGDTVYLFNNPLNDTVYQFNNIIYFVNNSLAILYISSKEVEISIINLN